MRKLSALALLVALPLLAATPAARQVYGLLWQKEFIGYVPCLLTLVTPAHEEERCLPWTRRVSSGPAFHAPSGILVVGGPNGTLHGLSARDGRILYRQPLPGNLVAKPVLVGEGAYFGTDEAHVLRVDATSGRIRWDVEVDAEVLEPVVVFEDLVLVVTGLDSVYAFDRKTGESRWVHKHPLPSGITLRGQARPLVVRLPGAPDAEARVYVGHATGRLTVLEASTGRVLDEWTLAKGEGFLDVDADPVFTGESIIAASHATGVFALDPLTGAARWQHEEPGFVRLAATRERVVAAGAGKVVGLDAETGAVRWRFRYERGAPTRIALKGGRVHLGSDRGALYVLDLLTGEPLQYFGSGLGFAADLELSGDMLFAVSTPGNLFALSNAFRGRLQK